MADPLRALSGPMIDPRRIAVIRPIPMRPPTGVHTDSSPPPVESRAPVERGTSSEPRGGPPTVVLATEEKAASQAVDEHRGIASGRFPVVSMPGVDASETTTLSVAPSSEPSAPDLERRVAPSGPSQTVIELYNIHAPAFYVADHAINLVAMSGRPEAQEQLLGLSHLEFMLHQAIQQERPAAARDIGQRLFNLSQETLRDFAPPVLSVSSHDAPAPSPVSTASAPSEPPLPAMSFSSIPVLAPRPRYLVGEGDFTYTRGLAAGGALPPGTKATSYVGLDQLRRDYRTQDGRQLKLDVTLQVIRAAGGEVAHGVDATDFARSSSPFLTDHLVFNFPHEGSTKNNLIQAAARSGHVLTDKQAEAQIIRNNQALLTGFFQSAHDKVAPGGTVEVTLKTSPPYDQWDVVGLARAQGWELQSSQPFAPPDQYGHVRTTTSARKDVSGGGARYPDTTYIFTRAGE